jgi:hypothetical protein
MYIVRRTEHRAQPITKGFVFMKIYMNEKYDKRYSRVDIFTSGKKGRIIEIRRGYQRYSNSEVYTTDYIFEEGMILKMETIIY